METNREINQYEEFYYDLANKGDKKSDKFQLIIEHIIKNHKVGDALLDVGCGTARVKKFLPSDMVYTGVDASEYAVEEAKKNTDAVVLHGLSHTLPFKDDSFSFVLSLYSLEHMEKPRESLLEMKRVLKPGGQLIVCAPNLELPFAYPSTLRHKSIFFRIYFHIVRFFDYIMRFFGVFSFRTLSENYLQHTGKYEVQDDDLVYLASTYEVISFLKKQGFKVLFANTINKKKGSFKDSLRQLLSHLPGLRYYGSELFIIFEKNK